VRPATASESSGFGDSLFRQELPSPRKVRGVYVGANQRFSQNVCYYCGALVDLQYSVDFIVSTLVVRDAISCELFLWTQLNMDFVPSERVFASRDGIGG
jgi:hypothetical protein